VFKMRENRLAAGLGELTALLTVA